MQRNTIQCNSLQSNAMQTCPIFLNRSLIITSRQSRLFSLEATLNSTSSSSIKTDQDPIFNFNCQDSISFEQRQRQLGLMNWVYLPDSSIEIIARQSEFFCSIVFCIGSKIVSKQRRQKGRFGQHTGFSCTGPESFDIFFCCTGSECVHNNLHCSDNFHLPAHEKGRVTTFKISLTRRAQVVQAGWLSTQHSEIELGWQTTGNLYQCCHLYLYWYCIFIICIGRLVSPFVVR